MNTKKSRAASILSIIYNVLSVPFWGYFTFVMYIFLDLSISAGAESSSYIEMLCLVLFLLASVIIGVVNFIMGIVSFTYVGKKSEKYNKGKKFIISYIILLFTQSLCNLILFVLMRSNLILAILPLLVAILSMISALLYLTNYIKNKKLQVQEEAEVVESAEEIKD